jgi:putative ABC transport system permease protein
MLNPILSDLRHATRALLRARGFTSVAIGTLAAALALSVSVMTIVNAYLVRGLPYPASDRLFNVRYAAPGVNMPRGMEALDWTTLDDIVEHPIAWDLDNFSLRGEPHPELAAGAWVTPGYIEGFGVRPAIGRGFEPADFQAGRPSVALISHRIWQARFAADPNVVGRQFQAHVDDRPGEVETFTVVGVLPQRLWHMNAFTEVLAPLRAPTFPYMVRLRDGVSPEIAAERIMALVREGNQGLPAGWRAELLSTHAEYVRQVRPLLLSLAAATLLVMLIACANVAVLLMVRASRRRREIAVRKALGATTARITRAVAAEALVLGAAATAAGIAVAQLVVTALAPALERQLGRGAPGGAEAIGIDGPIVLGGVAAGFLVSCACSLAPFWASSRTPVALALAAGQKGAGDGPGQRRARSALIALEVASSLALLVGAALMVQSGLRILRVDMGLDVRDVQVGRISLRPRAYPDPSGRNAFYDQVHGRVSSIPGVRAVAYANWWPLQAAPPRGVAREDAPADATTRAGVFGVSADYFTTLGIALRDGRAFTPADRPGTPGVAIVSETLARALWKERRAVGERIRIAPPDGATAPPASYVVVGVASDVRHVHTDDELADVYLALSQAPSPAVFTYLKTNGPHPTIDRDVRSAIAAVDRTLAFGTPRPLADILDQQRAGPRFLAALLVVFAIFAAALAIVGIYGVIAYAVRQREREIAVRMAIGADRPAIVRMFLRQGGVVLAGGLALGVAGAVVLGRVLQAQLFGVRAADPVVLAVTTAAFAVCGLLAVAWPARMAASTDPAAALKE